MSSIPRTSLLRCGFQRKIQHLHSPGCIRLVEPTPQPPEEPYPKDPRPFRAPDIPPRENPSIDEADPPVPPHRGRPPRRAPDLPISDPPVPLPPKPPPPVGLSGGLRRRLWASNRNAASIGLGIPSVKEATPTGLTPRHASMILHHLQVRSFRSTRHVFKDPDESPATSSTLSAIQKVRDKVLEPIADGTKGDKPENDWWLAITSRLWVMMGIFGATFLATYWFFKDLREINVGGLSHKRAVSYAGSASSAVKAEGEEEWLTDERGRGYMEEKILDENGREYVRRARIVRESNGNMYIEEMIVGPHGVEEFRRRALDQLK